jgi:hypothetical protein
MSSSKSRVAPWADVAPLGALSPLIVVAALISGSALLRIVPVLLGREPFGQKPALAAAVLALCLLLSFRSVIGRLRRRGASEAH